MYNHLWKLVMMLWNYQFDNDFFSNFSRSNILLNSPPCNIRISKPYSFFDTKVEQYQACVEQSKMLQIESNSISYFLLNPVKNTWVKNWYEWENETPLALQALVNFSTLQLNIIFFFRDSVVQFPIKGNFFRDRFSFEIWKKVHNYSMRQ